MTPLASPTRATPSPRCDSCGYLLTGLGDTGHCPECGEPFAPGGTGRRRPAPFETRPAVGPLVRTAAAALFRPGRFFGGLSAPSVGARAAWFARGHRAVAAAFFAVAIAGHLIVHTGFKMWLYNLATPASGPTYDAFVIDLSFTRFYWADEPTLFGLLLAPLALLIYLALALLTRAAARLATHFAAAPGGPPRRPVILRALRFHTVHWVPIALAAAITVGGPRSLEITPLAAAFYLLVASVTAFIAARTGRSTPPPETPRRRTVVRFVLGAIVILAACAWYFPRFESAHFDNLAIPPADPTKYHYALAAGAVVFPAYLLFTGWIAVGRMMYANPDQREASHAPV